MKTDVKNMVFVESKPETTLKMMCHSNESSYSDADTLVTWDNAKYEHHSIYFVHSFVFSLSVGFSLAAGFSHLWFFFSFFIRSIFLTHFSHSVVDLVDSILFLVVCRFGPSHLNSTIIFYPAFNSISVFWLFLTFDPWHRKGQHMKTKQKKKNTLSL